MSEINCTAASSDLKFYYQGSAPGKLVRFLPYFDSTGKILKDIHRKVVMEVTLDGKLYHLKRYSFRGSLRWKDQLRGSGWWWFKSKALQHYQNARLMDECGLTIVPVVGVIERRYKLLKQESMIVTRHVGGSSLGELLEQADSSSGWLQLVETFISQLKQLHTRKIAHGDPHAGNLLVASGRLWWCDFGTIKRNIEADQISNEILYSLRSLLGKLQKTAHKNSIQQLFSKYYPEYTDRIDQTVVELANPSAEKENS